MCAQICTQQHPPPPQKKYSNATKSNVSKWWHRPISTGEASSSLEEVHAQICTLQCTSPPPSQGTQQQKHMKASPTCFTLKMSFPSCTAGTPRMASTSMLHSTSQLPQKRQRSSSITCLPHNRPHPPYLLPAQVLARTHEETEDRKYIVELNQP